MARQREPEAGTASQAPAFAFRAAAASNTPPTPTPVGNPTPTPMGEEPRPNVTSDIPAATPAGDQANQGKEQPPKTPARRGRPPGSKKTTTTSNTDDNDLPEPSHRRSRVESVAGASRSQSTRSTRLQAPAMPMSDPEKALRAKTSKAKKRLRQSAGTAGEPPKTVCRGKGDDAKLNGTVGEQPSPHRQNKYTNVTNINVAMSDERRELLERFQATNGSGHRVNQSQEEEPGILGELTEDPESPDPLQDLEDWNRGDQSPSPTPGNQDAQPNHGSTHE